MKDLRRGTSSHIDKISLRHHSRDCTRVSENAMAIIQETGAVDVKSLAKTCQKINHKCHSESDEQLGSPQEIYKGEVRFEPVDKDIGYEWRSRVSYVRKPYLGEELKECLQR